MLGVDCGPSAKAQHERNMARENTSPAIRPIRSHSGSFILVLPRSRFQCVCYRAEKIAAESKNHIIAFCGVVYRASRSKVRFSRGEVSRTSFLRAPQVWQGRTASEIKDEVCSEAWGGGPLGGALASGGRRPKISRHHVVSCRTRL